MVRGRRHGWSSHGSTEADNGGTVRRLWRPAACLVVAITAFVLMVRTMAPYGESADVPPGTAFGALGLLVLSFLAACMTPVLGWLAWRDHRRANGHLSKAEQAARARAASIHAIHADGWERGRQWAIRLSAGQPPPPLSVWGLVLHHGEQAHIDAQIHYARYYGGDGSYHHVSGMFFGNPAFVIAGLAATAIGNSARRSRAQAAAMHCWREHQPARVIATDQRLICQVNGTWLSFYFGAMTAFYPEPSNYSVVFDFSETSPLRLSGPDAPLLAVYATWRLHGADAITGHPALAPLTAPRSQPHRTPKQLA